MEIPLDIQYRYLEHRKRDLIECLLFLDRKNFKELEKVGHQLKGNSPTFGFPELAVVGSKLELAAQAEDAVVIESALEDFAICLNLC